MLYLEQDPQLEQSKCFGSYVNEFGVGAEFLLDLKIGSTSFITCFSHLHFLIDFNRLDEWLPTIFKSLDAAFGTSWVTVNCVKDQLGRP